MGFPYSLKGPAASGTTYHFASCTLQRSFDGDMHHALQMYTDHMPDGTEEEVINSIFHCPNVVQVL